MFLRINGKITAWLRCEGAIGCGGVIGRECCDFSRLTANRHRPQRRKGAEHHRKSILLILTRFLQAVKSLSLPKKYYCVLIFAIDKHKKI